MENKFKVGDRVKISVNSPWYYSDLPDSTNPINTEGTIKYINKILQKEGLLYITVDWNNSKTNWYREDDLELIGLDNEILKLKTILSDPDSRILTDNDDRIMIHRLCVEFGINLHNIEASDEKSPTRNGQYNELIYKCHKTSLKFLYDLKTKNKDHLVFKDIISEFNKYKNEQP